MLNSKLLSGICLIAIVINSCAVHKHKNHVKPCNCPDNTDNVRNKKHSEIIFHYQDKFNIKDATYHFA